MSVTVVFGVMGFVFSSCQNLVLAGIVFNFWYIFVGILILSLLVPWESTPILFRKVLMQSSLATIVHCSPTPTLCSVSSFLGEIWQ